MDAFAALALAAPTPRAALGRDAPPHPCTAARDASPAASSPSPPPQRARRPSFSEGAREAVSGAVSGAVSEPLHKLRGCLKTAMAAASNGGKEGDDDGAKPEMPSLPATLTASRGRRRPRGWTR